MSARPAEPPPAGGASAHAARFAAAGRVAPAARDAAARAIVDTLAVMVAGGQAGPVRRLEMTLAPAAGQGVRSPWSEAAYAPQDAHMLDYDDVSMLTVCHPSGPVLSALLAGGLDAVSGAELLDAFAIGTEVSIRLGEAMGFRHYGLGFHATSTLGTVGAAAASARLKRLEPATVAHALAIAASLACGLRINFGTPVKPLHVGIAAGNGVKAAAWAAAGIEGAPEAFEGAGFLAAFSGGATDRWPQAARLGTPFAIVEPGFERKRYPCCYMLHKIVEATLGLAREHGLGLDDVAAAAVEVPPGGSAPLIHPRPGDGLQARFSAPYAVLASLADRRLDLGAFTDEAVRRPHIQSRLSAVTLRERDGAATSGPAIEQGPVTVTLTLRDGSSLARTVTATPGSPADPVTDEQLLAKWLDCFGEAAPGADAGTLTGLFERGLGLEREASVAGWLGAVRAAATSSTDPKVRRLV